MHRIIRSAIVGATATLASLSGSLLLAPAPAAQAAADCGYGYSPYCNIQRWIASSQPKFIANGQYCRTVKNNGAETIHVGIDSDGKHDGSLTRIKPGKSATACGSLAKGSLAHAFVRARLSGSEDVAGGVWSPRYGKGSMTSKSISRSGANPLPSGATLNLRVGGKYVDYAGPVNHGKKATVSSSKKSGQMVRVSWNKGGQERIIDLHR